jgi:asparagine synthase (glutamine-hydrolysing)
MAGFCGWTCESDDRLADPKHVTRASKALTEFGDAPTQAASASNFRLISSGRPTFSSFANGEAGSAVVHGHVASSDRELQELINSLGAARAILQSDFDQKTPLLSTLSGTFALAVIQADGKSVLLATDGAGGIPINYCIRNEELAFATTTRAIRALSFSDLEVDDQAVLQYLYFHSIPSPYSIFKNVKKMLPRRWLHWDGKHVSEGEYRKIRWMRRGTKAPAFRERKDELMEVLDRSVARAVEGEAGLGCFLSGGTDSSTLAGVMSQRLGMATKTFSIGFDETGYDEMEFAKTASGHFRTEHHEYYVTRQDVADLIPRISDVYDEPFGNSSAVPTYYCAQMARSAGVARMVAGDGGDEIFGGNTRYSDQLVFNFYDQLPSSLRQYFLGPICKSLPLGLLPTRKIRRYVEQAELRMPDRMFTYNHLRRLGTFEMLTPDFVDGVDAFRPESDLAEFYESADADGLVDRMLSLDLKFTIADNDLPKVVTMCEMANCDVVFPFLDPEMIDFSTSLPPRWKARTGRLRVFFKNALDDFLPREIIEKKKHGFGLPFGRWLAQDEELRAITEDCLVALAGRGIIRLDFVRRLLDQHLDEHSAYYGGFAWVLVQLEMWYRKHDRAVKQTRDT